MMGEDNIDSSSTANTTTDTAVTGLIPAKRTVSEMEDSSSDNNNNIMPNNNTNDNENLLSNDNRKQYKESNGNTENNKTTMMDMDTSEEVATTSSENNSNNNTDRAKNKDNEAQEQKQQHPSSSSSTTFNVNNISRYDENDDHHSTMHPMIQSRPFSIMSILKPCIISCNCTYTTALNNNNDTSLSNFMHDNEEIINNNRNTNNDIISDHRRLNTIKGSRESIIQEYLISCNIYGIPDRINAGVLTTIRFSLPNLRVSGSFHDADMLALSEILLKHCNTSLKFIKRLDFSIASKQGKLYGKLGFGSHGAFILSKILQKSEYIEELYISKHRIGPFGSSAIFQSLANNKTLKTIVMRNCSIMERGASAFVEYVCNSNSTAVREVDFSVNAIGFVVSSKIEQSIIDRKRRNLHVIEVDLEGNLIFQEVMNCVTHGLGIILCIIGTYLLSERVKDKSLNHRISCGIYSTSLLVLYTSSTLFHSFFALQTTKYIFGILDHCGIYILIAGSYTPYLSISLHDKPIWSKYLLAFIWLLGMLGVAVESLGTGWKHKSKFSLAMYLGMGWCCMVCVPDLVVAVPQGAVNLLVLGGVCYTGGVPFFKRNNNLDHSIWHCFVLAGSMSHWFGVYSYVAMID